MSLILKSALLAWIEAQLHTVQASEAPAWAMILENIMVVVDSGKLDSGTYGSWRSNVARCLLSLLDQTGMS
jgi:nucleolar pre-ribosomal-associated protein 1